MREIHTRLFVGDMMACRLSNADTAVVHACKSPCHQEAVSYTGNLPRTHDNYLWLERDNDLYLNMIDPKIPLFMPETFEKFLSFAAARYAKGMTLVVHCNQGQSRAPSLAMLFMVKYLKAINGPSYDAAKESFMAIYPDYAPNDGIVTFLTKNWFNIGSSSL